MCQKSVSLNSESSHFFDSWGEVRDDLEFVLEEDLTEINLCALHAENRNTEQVLISLGVMAIQCNSLQECNAKLKEFGPANFKKDRIKVKLRQGQETEISRGNLKIASMSGNSNSLPLHQRPKTCVWAGGTVPL